MAVHDHDHDHDHDHAPVAIEPERSVHRSVVVDDRPTSGEMVRRVVLLAFGILQALLILRIVLLLLVANPGNEVVAFVLGVTDPFVEPFRGMFQLDRIGSDAGSVLDVAGGVALLGWTLIEMLVLAAFSIGARRGEDSTV
jgi:uncharacterized protein YggT (Ycf19 family)